ncbi:MAG: hypothetical protein AB1758_32130, partial [Candidatus Eremiobacterota bacterium]
LRLAVFPIYSLFHPPLLIPWEDLGAQVCGPTARFSRWLVGGRTVRLIARRAQGVSMVIPEKLARRLAEEAGEFWPQGRKLLEEINA